MNSTRYAKAYTEVLEIIKYFPQNEYSKIPNTIIEYYKNNMDKNYSFSINPQINLEEQNISKEALSIIILLFRDYFATDKQKETLENLLNQNQEKKNARLIKEYPTDVFKNKKGIRNTYEKEQKNFAMVEYKEPILKKFFNRLLIFLHIK